MAIDPSDVYGSQTDTSDPNGYPLGKARNELVEGDNIGTPFEAMWLNDLWGFLQSLLNAVGATPTGTPDKVGASQYLNAIQSLINKLKTSENVWTKKQTFNWDVFLADNVVLNLRRFGRINYLPDEGDDEPPLRWIMVPLKPTQAAGWVFSPGNTSGTPPAWTCGSGGTPYVQMIGVDILPSDALIKAVRACVSSSIDVTLTAGQTVYDTGTSNGGVNETEYTDSFNPVSPGSHVLEANVPDALGPSGLVHFNDSKTLLVKVTPEPGAGCALRWIQIGYYDRLLTNA